MAKARLVVLVVSIAIGCSSAGHQGSSGLGGAIGSGGGRGGTGGLPACTRIDTSAAPNVPISHTDDPMPTPVGGTIATGTYYLTEWMNYGGSFSNDPSCATFKVREVMRFTTTSPTEGTASGTSTLNAGVPSLETNHPNEKWLGSLVNTFDSSDGCVGVATDGEIGRISNWVRTASAERIELR